MSFMSLFCCQRMASADLRQELDCSICLSTYTDPVNLTCGHNFCRVCIDRALDTQDGSGGYSCPECREEFQDRPVLHRNITLSNIAETSQSTQPDLEKTTGIFYLNTQEASDVALDVNTAHNNLQISEDMKSVSWSDIEQNHPQTPERFQDYFQVLRSQCFSSGRHYWEVDFSESDWWMVGMCYPSTERRGVQSGIGNSNKSWGLYIYSKKSSAWHNNERIEIPGNISSDRVRIYLDYEAGQLSFYDLCDPIQHLHTFTTTFTEPLHAGLCVMTGRVKISGGSGWEK